jgi:hypothetical protein
MRHTLLTLALLFGTVPAAPAADRNPPAAGKSGRSVTLAVNGMVATRAC